MSDEINFKILDVYHEASKQGNVDVAVAMIIALSKSTHTNIYTVLRTIESTGFEADVVMAKAIIGAVDDVLA